MACKEVEEIGKFHRKRRRHVPEMVARIWWWTRILEVVFGLGALVKDVKDVGIRVVASRISGTKIASIGKTPGTIVVKLFALVAVRTILAGTVRLVVVTNAIEFGGTRVLRNIAGKVGYFCNSWKWCWDGRRGCGRRWRGSWNC